MRKNRNLSFIAIALIIIGCFSSTSDKVIPIDYQSWKANTSSFIKNKCDVVLNDSIKLGEDIVPVKYKENIYYTFKDYFESKISNRSQLINYLEKNREVYKDIHILENYSRGKAKILVSLDEKKLFSFTISNGELNVTTSKGEENIEKLFSPLEKDEKECFSEYVSIPQYFRIFSRYDTKSESLITYQVSMYD